MLVKVKEDIEVKEEDVEGAKCDETRRELKDEIELNKTYAHKDLQILMYEDKMVNIKKEIEDYEEEGDDENKKEAETKIEPEELDYAHEYLQKLDFEISEVKIKKEIQVNEEGVEDKMDTEIKQVLEIKDQPTRSCEALTDCDKSMYEDIKVKIEEVVVNYTNLYQNVETKVKEEHVRYEKPMKNASEDMLIKSNNYDVEQLCSSYPMENDELSWQWNKSIIDSSENMVDIKKESILTLNSNDENDYIGITKVVRLANKRSCNDESSDSKREKNEKLSTFKKKRGRPFMKKRGRPRNFIDYKETVEEVHFKRKRGRPKKNREFRETGIKRTNKNKPKVDPYSLLCDEEILARNPCPTLKKVKLCVDRLSPKSFLNSISKEIPGINMESVKYICKQLIKIRKSFRERFIQSQKRYIKKNRGVLPKIDCADLVDPNNAISFNDVRKEIGKLNPSLSIENEIKDPAGILDPVNHEQPIPKLSEKDPFNYKTDNLNQSKPSEEMMKLSKNDDLLRHSTPVLELQPPFIPTYMGEKKMRLFHKPPIKRYSHGPLADPGLHQVHTLTKEIKKKAKLRKFWRFSSSGEDVFFMQTPEDLTGKDGDMIMIEYSEEHPPLLSQVGMCSLIKNYYNWQVGIDKDPPNYRYGGTCFLQKAPFLALMHPGQSIQTMENNMYRSPIHEHKMPLTDFLIIRSRTGYCIREIDALFTSGQQCPFYEAPTPNSKHAITFMKNFLQVFIYHLFWKSNDIPRRVKMDKIKQAFPTHSESSIRKCLKPCADFKRTGVDSNWWVIKPDFELPTKNEISAMVSPEQCCAFFSMAAAQQKLKDAGYGDASHLSLDDDNEDESQKLDYEIKVAPWHPVTPYVQAVRGRDLLQRTGETHLKENGAKPDEEEMNKFSRGNSFYRAEQQERYKEECQNIFDHQTQLLGSTEVLLTDKGESEDDDNDSESDDTIKKIENNFVYRKPSSQLTLDKEELENKEFNKLKQDVINKDPECTKMYKREDSRVLRISRTYISSEGKEYTRTEIVRKSEVIDAYVKIKTLKDDNFIKIFKEDIDESQKEEMKRERRRIQERLRRLKRNRENKQKGIVSPVRIRKAKLKPDLKLTCGACGQVGHMRTNKTCSLYEGLPQFESENQENMENPNIKESEELVVVDGTKIKFSSKVIKYAEELKNHSLALNSYKNQVKNAKPMRARAGTVNHCDYLNRKEKPINRRRIDPLVTLSTIFEEIINELREMPGAEPFIYPVNQKTVPDYYNIITKPMDLLTIRNNLLLKKYLNREEFFRDISQIVENSKVYNGIDSTLTAASKKLLHICINHFSKKREMLIRLEKSINPLLDDEQVAFDFILTQIMNERLFTNQVSWPFLKPVNKKYCKDYYNIIQHPMDLSTIERKIKSHRYHNRADFMADIKLIEINARNYNGCESSFTKKAQALIQITKASLGEWESDFEKLESALALSQECALEQPDTNSVNNSIEPDDDTNNNFTKSEHKEEDQAQQALNAAMDHSCKENTKDMKILNGDTNEVLSGGQHLEQDLATSVGDIVEENSEFPDKEDIQEMQNQVLDVYAVQYNKI